MKKKVALAAVLVGLGTIALWATESENMSVYGQLGKQSAMADFGEFTNVRVINETGAPVMQLGWWADSFAGSTARGDGSLILSDLHGNRRIIASIWPSGEGYVAVLDSGGNPAAGIDGATGLWSRKGDIAEQFVSGGSQIAPGSVVVLDSDNPGALTLSTSAYDRKVAGVVSGASDYEPGITLGKRDQVGHVPVTLTGTAYCLVTNSNGAIKAGDLLTTSSVPGHAMKVTDFGSSQGAILGKAMQDFDEESGLVMILAALQ